MPYNIKIREQKTGKEIKMQIESLKELKMVLLEYKDQLIDFEMREVKRKKKNVWIMGKKNNDKEVWIYNCVWRWTPKVLFYGPTWHRYLLWSNDIREQKFKNVSRIWKKTIESIAKKMILLYN